MAKKKADDALEEGATDDTGADDTDVGDAADGAPDEVESTGTDAGAEVDDAETADDVDDADVDTNDADVELTSETVESEFGPAVESTIAPGPAIPSPIVATTSPSARHRRVMYENTINAGAELFAARARATYIETALAGGTVELTVTFPNE